MSEVWEETNKLTQGDRDRDGDAEPTIDDRHTTKDGESRIDTSKAISVTKDQQTYAAKSQLSLEGGDEMIVASTEVGEDTPNVQGDTPNVQGDTPNVQGDTPNVQGDTPNVQGDTPNVQEDTPNVQGDTLIVQGDTLIVQGDTPTIANDQLAELRSVEVKTGRGDEEEHSGDRDRRRNCGDKDRERNGGGEDNGEIGGNEENTEDGNKRCGRDGDSARRRDETCGRENGGKEDDSGHRKSEHGDGADNGDRERDGMDGEDKNMTPCEELERIIKEFENYKAATMAELQAVRNNKETTCVRGVCISATRLAEAEAKIQLLISQLLDQTTNRTDGKETKGKKTETKVTETETKGKETETGGKETETGGKETETGGKETNEKDKGKKEMSSSPTVIKENDPMQMLQKKIAHLTQAHEIEVNGLKQLLKQERDLTRQMLESKNAEIEALRSSLERSGRGSRNVETVFTKDSVPSHVPMRSSNLAHTQSLSHTHTPSHNFSHPSRITEAASESAEDEAIDDSSAPPSSPRNKEGEKRDTVGLLVKWRLKYIETRRELKKLQAEIVLKNMAADIEHMQYMRSVLMKFLSSDPVGAIDHEMLIPVICRMLQLSQEEIAYMQTHRPKKAKSWFEI